mmetsp:Transcript_4190/g.13115  ORF Transcript_4190/g.13115 Transcript_4190/m.13115 type:complete len:255 (+) Transcript_4190:1618-2382(+)
MVGVTVGVLLGDAHLEEVVCTHLQDVPLHWVHHPCLCRNDLKVLVVKELNALNNRHVLAARLPGHNVVRVGVIVLAHIPANIRDLAASITTAKKSSPVHLRLVPGCHEAGRQVDDVDGLIRGTWRSLSEAQPIGVPLPIGQGQLVRLLKEGGGQREALLLKMASEVENPGAVDQDRVGHAVDVNGFLLEGQRLCLALILGLQGHRAHPRAHEVDNLQEAPSPSSQETAEHRVVRVLRWKLGLLVIREGKADQAR